MRCPPGPYERASLVAEFLAKHKPRSKVLIFDANNRFPRQDAFTTAWKEIYGDRIEWIPVTEGGAVERVDVRTNTLYTASGAHHVAVANVIAPQAPGAFALDAGLASGHGWCPVDPTTFESMNVPRVHVIGDACIADAMPKAASAALSQATQCAAAIVARFANRAPTDAGARQRLLQRARARPFARDPCAISRRRRARRCRARFGRAASDLGRGA